jgi:hypothetical protein
MAEKQELLREIARNWDKEQDAGYGNPQSPAATAPFERGLGEKSPQQPGAAAPRRGRWELLRPKAAPQGGRCVKDEDQGQYARQLLSKGA